MRILIEKYPFECYICKHNETVVWYTYEGSSLKNKMKTARTQSLNYCLTCSYNIYVEKCGNQQKLWKIDDDKICNKYQLIITFIMISTMIELHYELIYNWSCFSVTVCPSELSEARIIMLFIINTPTLFFIFYYYQKCFILIYTEKFLHYRYGRIEIFYNIL